MKKIFSAILLLFITSALFAQNNTLYFMEAVPYSRINPARQSENTWYMGFPMLGHMQLSLATPQFSLNDFTEKKDGNLVVDLNKLVDKLDHRNRVNFVYEQSIVDFGFKAGDIYVDFGWSLKNEARMALPGDMARLFTDGNASFVNDPADFSPLWFNAQSYMEMAVGLNKQINEKLTVGARPKILFGIANTNMSFDKFQISVDPDTYNMRFAMDGAFRTNMPLMIEKDDDDRISNAEFDDDINPTDYFMKNTGFAIDLGGHYQFSDKIEFEAALVDFGFIRWSSESTALSSKGDFDFEGVKYNGDTDIEDFGDQLQDDLEKTFTVDDTKEAYSTWLTTKILLGARYKVNDSFKVGAMMRNRIYNKSYQPALTLSANYQPIKFIGLTGTYSMADGSFANFGAGLNLNLGAMQLHVVTDNIRGLVAPHTSHYSSIQFGINWTFGFRKKSKVVDVKVEEEKPEKKEGEAAPVY